MQQGLRRQADAKLVPESAKGSADGAFDFGQQFVDADAGLVDQNEARTIKSAKQKCVIKMCWRVLRNLIKDKLKGQNASKKAILSEVVAVINGADGQFLASSNAPYQVRFFVQQAYIQCNDLLE